MDNLNLSNPFVNPIHYLRLLYNNEMIKLAENKDSKTEQEQKALDNLYNYVKENGIFKINPIRDTHTLKYLMGEMSGYLITTSSDEVNYDLELERSNYGKINLLLNTINYFLENGVLSENGLVLPIFYAASDEDGKRLKIIQFVFDQNTIDTLTINKDVKTIHIKELISLLKLSLFDPVTDYQELVDNLKNLKKERYVEMFYAYPASDESLVSEKELENEGIYLCRILNNIDSRLIGSNIDKYNEFLPNSFEFEIIHKTFKFPPGQYLIKDPDNVIRRIVTTYNHSSLMFSKYDPDKYNLKDFKYNVVLINKVKIRESLFKPNLTIDSIEGNTNET